MGIRKIDILQSKPVTKYDGNTPYSADGDNTPLIDLDFRATFYSDMYTKGGWIVAGKPNGAETYVSGQCVACNVNPNSANYNKIFLFTNGGKITLEKDEVIGIVTVIDNVPAGSGTSIKYTVAAQDYYYCLLKSGYHELNTIAAANLFDYSLPALVGRRAGETDLKVGDILYIRTAADAPDTSGRIAVYPPGIDPAGNDVVEYATSVPVAVGIITGLNLAAHKAIVQFGQQNGLGAGIGATGNKAPRLHSSLSDIAAQTSFDPSTWVSPTNDSFLGGHFQYAAKLFTLIQDSQTGALPGQPLEWNAGILQKSTGNYDISTHQYAGILLFEKIVDAGPNYTIYVHIGGVWTDSTFARSGGVDEGFPALSVASGINIKIGDELWDGSTASFATITNIKPSALTASYRKVGVKIDDGLYLLNPTWGIQEARTDIMNSGPGELSSQGIQTLPAWLRVSATDFEANPAAQQLIQGDVQKPITGIPIQISPMVQDTTNKNHWFSISEYIDPYRSSVANPNAVVIPAASCGNIWSKYDGNMTGITYDPKNKTLTFVGDAEFNFFIGAERGAPGTTQYPITDNSINPSTLSPNYKVGLPWVGLLSLAHAIQGYESAAVFSYKRYVGYGTKTLTFYNVEFYKKFNTNDEWSAGAWVGSDPGYAPSEYFNSNNANYQNYKSANLPNWTPSNPGRWLSNDSTNWYLKALPVGGLKLKIKGNGTFDRVAIQTLESSTVGQFTPAAFKGGKISNYNPNFMASTFGYGNTMLSPAVFDSYDNNSSDNSDPRSFWAPNASTAGLWNLPQGSSSSSIPTNFMTKYNYFDQIIASPATKVVYPNGTPMTYDGALGMLGYPSYTTGAGSSPSIVWLSHKEIWIDTATLVNPGTTNILFVSIGDEIIIPATQEHAVDSQSIIEVTIAQSGVNDPEDSSFAIDKIVLGNKEFTDLLEGDSIRFNVQNRLISPTYAIGV